MYSTSKPTAAASLASQTLAASTKGRCRPPCSARASTWKRGGCAATGGASVARQASTNRLHRTAGHAIPERNMKPPDVVYKVQRVPRLEPPDKRRRRFFPCRDLCFGGYFVNNMKYLMISRVRTALGDSLLHAAVSGLMLAGVAAFLFSESPAQPGQPAGSLINPAGIAFNPASRKVYAVDTARNQVEIARAGEPGTLRVAVGAAPIALAINAHTNRIFVANAGDGTVSVIDGTGDQVTSRLQVGPRPYSIAVNAATGRVYLTHTFNDDLTVIDEATPPGRPVCPGSRHLLG